MTDNRKRWTAGSIPSQAGRRVLITGANSGIGFETARELARTGAEIILPARSIAKANDAAERIRSETPSASIVPAVLDLASQASVREFASWFSALFPAQSIDLLIITQA
jgi:NAD(P)-dependent dehydrogenase (short-subunit alcohol dehydrogenase family)